MGNTFFMLDLPVAKEKRRKQKRICNLIEKRRQGRCWRVETYALRNGYDVFLMRMWNSANGSTIFFHARFLVIFKLSWLLILETFKVSVKFAKKVFFLQF